VLAPFHNITKVLLLPCREPIDHLKSMCNFEHRNVTEMFKLRDCEKARKCYMGFNRFENIMLEDFQYVIPFKYSNFAAVDDELDRHLMRRVLPLKSTEIYVKNDPRPQIEDMNGCEEEVEAFMRMDWPYYNFCSKYLKGDATVIKLKNTSRDST
jgi:hypothetical protein